MSDDFSLVAEEENRVPPPQMVAPESSPTKTDSPKKIVPLFPSKPASEPTIELVAPEPLLSKPEPEPVKSVPVIVEPAKVELQTKKRGRPPKPAAPKVPAWEPTESDLKMISDLAELGWPCNQIAEVMNLSTQAFAYAITSNPAIKQAYDAGVESGKTYVDRKLAWRPLPSDLDKVRDYAASGLREVEIAAKLNVSRNSFTARMNDTPQLRAAYEQGEGHYRASRMIQFDDLIDREAESLKHMNGPLSFILKTRCEMSDKPSTQKVEITGQVSHTVGLKAPDKVPAKDIAAFAQAEMARATAISAKNLAAVMPAEEVVDVEVSK